jgi:hypothetical protein
MLGNLHSPEVVLRRSPLGIDLKVEGTLEHSQSVAHATS